MLALYLLGGALGLTYFLWVLYLAVMNLKRVKDTVGLPPEANALGSPLLVLGLIVDLLVNVLVMTPLLLELPREWLVTARLKRHNKSAGTSLLARWRRWVAHRFEPILDPFDPSGDHI